MTIRGITTDDFVAQLAEGLVAFADVSSLATPLHPARPLPSLDAIATVMALLRAGLFPGYFAPLSSLTGTMRQDLVRVLEQAATELATQIALAYRGVSDSPVAKDPSYAFEKEAQDATLELIRSFPSLRGLLNSDVDAAMEGDPAARLKADIILSYPSLKALAHHRIAHSLHKLGVPLIPRMIAALAQAATGIDIHPGACIGSHCFIDHGTGVVIGETAIIGDHVRLYQGVTLGAKSFAKDRSGTLIKGMPRHPIVEDNVVIYAGAAVLGRVTIGRNAVIGGNVWVTSDVPAGTRVLQSRYTEENFKGFGDGI